jgi:hypothetical protein
MTNTLAVLRRIIFASAAAAFIAVLELIALGPDVLRPTLILFLATLPSIIAYVLCEQFAPPRTKLRYALFLAPAALIAAVCLSAQTARSAYFDVPALYRWILVGYLLQLATAYLVLLVSRPKQ